MIRHVFSVVCQSASVDQFSNSLSISNVIEHVQAQSVVPVPVLDPPHGMPFECTVLSLWFNDGSTDEESKQCITLIAPDGRRFNPNEAAMLVRSGQMHRMIAKVPALPYFGNGRYWFEIALRVGKHWEPAALLPFTITVSVATPPPA